MGAMTDDLPPAPPAITCYRHPEEPTGVRCTRCERPICPACMIPAPVGYQCPECVAAARKEFRLGPARRARSMARTPATRVLLAAILAAFVLEIALGGPRALLNGPSGQRLFDLGGLYAPAIAFDGQYWRLLSSMFLHAGLLHVGFNSYALWLFGSAVEGVFGRARFLAIYFVTGLVAGASSYAFGATQALGVGASGAIFGVFGAFVAYYYRRRHLALASANLRSAITIVLLNVFLGLSIPGIDLRAHIGGFVAGLAAGVVSDEVGPLDLRRLLHWGGLLAIALLGVGLVMWRTAQLRSLPFGPGL